MLLNRFVALLLTWALLMTDAIRAEEKIYEEVVSLGSSCQVAWQLEAHCVRKAAYPFDWLITHSKALNAFLCRKGKGFLNWDKITVIRAYPGDPAHLEVVDQMYGLVSLHDFLANPPMENYYEVKAKYDRRLARFFELLNSNKTVLFVRQGSSCAEIKELDSLLHTLYPNLSYTILAVHNFEEYKTDWGLERVKNYFLTQIPGDWAGDFDKWGEILGRFIIHPALTACDSEKK